MSYSPPNPNGQATMASSSPIVFASDQSILPVGNVATIGTSIVPGTGTTHLGKAEDAAAADGDTGVMVLTVRRDSAASSAGTTGDYATFNTDNTGRLWVNVGAISSTSFVPGTAATNLGKAEDVAHVSGDTGVFALAVRNDGSATSFSGTNGDYTPVATDDQGNVFIVRKAQTSSTTSVASSASNVTILAANNARKGATITNDSSVVLYIKLGTTASTSSYTVVLAGAVAAPFAYYEVPFGYVGIIDGIWASATGNARITELT